MPHFKLPSIPRPSDKRIAIHITRAAEREIRSGHPWLFDGAIQKQSHAGQAGDLAVIFDHNRRFLAIGLYDPHSAIRVKILHHQSPVPIDREFFHAKITAAATIRKHLFYSGTTGYRLIHGENDSLPGLIVGRFGDTLVMKLYTTAWIPHLSDVLHSLVDVQPTERVILRLSRAVIDQPEVCFGLMDGQVMYGNDSEGDAYFTENGLNFAADVVHGHKTGFFFDQRDNRELVGRYAAGKSVLDVFAYTGGFSVYAARGGATSVISLDVSEPALAAAKHNLELNMGNATVAACQHEVMAADAFNSLQDLAAVGRRFDMVIVDPPSFANRADQIEGALKSYARLTALALGVLKPHGMLVLASCSSRVSAEDFFGTVMETATEVGRTLWVYHKTGHALDHPIGFAEGAYLKCLFATTVD